MKISTFRESQSIQIVTNLLALDIFDFPIINSTIYIKVFESPPIAIQVNICMSIGINIRQNCFY